MTSRKPDLGGAAVARRRPPLAVWALSLLAVAAAACGTSGSGNSSGSTAVASKQVLHFPIYADPQTMDPALGDQEIESELSENVFDNLWLFDKTLNIVPDIATAVPTIWPGVCHQLAGSWLTTFWSTTAPVVPSRVQAARHHPQGLASLTWTVSELTAVRPLMAKAGFLADSWVSICASVMPLAAF